MSRSLRVAWLPLALAAGMPACEPAKAPEVPVGSKRVKRDTELVHEPCDLNSAEVVKRDADADGRPEIVHVMSGGRELCRAVDINLDGVIDAYVYFDELGRVRRRESGFDRDAQPDEIAIYEGGVLVRKERETNNDGKIDTWSYYEGGLLVREERDSVGEGYVNQWWRFKRPGDASCAVVMTDGDGDGEPDPGSELDLCPEAPPPTAADSAAPDEDDPPKEGSGAAAPGDGGSAASEERGAAGGATGGDSPEAPAAASEETEGETP